MIDLLQESIKELKLHNAKRRENHIEKLLDYYNGNNTKQYIEQMFSADAFSEIPPVEANITRRFINKMSRIYTIGANRNVNDKYDELTVLKSARMKHVERMTRLIGLLQHELYGTRGKLLILTIVRFIFFMYSSMTIPSFHLPLLIRCYSL